MSSASAPSIAPRPTVPQRKLPSAQGGNTRYWLAGLALVIVAAIGWWALSEARARTAAPTTIVIPTATVTSGTLEQTIRLSGTTAARQFALLVTPTLRGSRGGGGRDASVPASGVNTNIVVQSNNSTSSSSSSGSSSTSTSNSLSGVGSSTDNNAGPTSTANGSTSSLSSAMQSATSRVNVGGAQTSSHISGSNETNALTDAQNALGSTADSLVSTGGGGGGINDFGLTLQHLVPAGSHVKKGQIVAEFDRQYMLQRLDDYKSSVTQTEAAVRKMKAELEVGRKAHQQQLDVAKSDVDKAKLDLKAAPVLGTMDTERLKLALEESEAQYKELVAETKFIEAGQAAQSHNAEMSLERSQIEFKRAQMNADRMLLKAPIDGLVVVQQTFRGSEFGQIQEGDSLSPGEPVVQVVDTSSLVVNASVNQVDVERVRIGQTTTVHFDAYPGLSLRGHVYSIGAITKAGGMRANFVKEIPVQIRLDEADPRVVPDLSVSVDVVLNSAEHATIAPLNAIFRNADGASVVYIKRDGTWEPRTVETGLASNTAVDVKSGLQAGDVVAIINEPPSDKQT